MPTIKDFGAFKISIYFGDHNPPHFHVVSQEFAARLRIEDGEILAGELPIAVRRRVRHWATSNRKLLVAAWTKYNAE